LDGETFAGQKGTLNNGKRDKGVANRFRSSERGDEQTKKTQYEEMPQGGGRGVETSSVKKKMGGLRKKKKQTLSQESYKTTQTLPVGRDLAL